MRRAPLPEATALLAKYRGPRVRIRRGGLSRCGSPACGFRYRFKKLRVSRAAAKIAGKPFADFFKTRLRVLAQEMMRGQDHSRCANAALGAAAVEKGLL